MKVVRIMMVDKKGSLDSFDEIWTVEPERHNRFSSAWWFFYLFPEGEQGYGTEQMMVAVMANKNKVAKFNGMKVKPMNVEYGEGQESFNSAIDAWHMKDGEFKELLKEPFRVELSNRDSLNASKNLENLEKSLKIKALSDKEGFEVRLRNEDIKLEFKSFNRPNCEENWPKETYNADKFGLGANDIDWTRMQFEGEIEDGDQKRKIEGVSYFQRVCLHIPLMPWKWIYTVFPNGDVFIAFIPYLGLQHIRRKYKFSSSETIENLTYPISTSGKWIKPETGETIHFDKIKIKPELRENKAPDFKIKAKKQGEGTLSFTAYTKNQIENLMEKPLLFGLTKNKYFYNEYVFKVKNFKSDIEKIQMENPENGHGNLEYSWGQWL